MRTVYDEGSADCAHEWFNFHDGSDRLCEKCKRHELRPDSDSALLIAARSRISALEGLLRECANYPDVRADKRFHARLDAALTKDKP